MYCSYHPKPLLIVYLFLPLSHAILTVDPFTAPAFRSPFCHTPLPFPFLYPDFYLRYYFYSLLALPLPSSLSSSFLLLIDLYLCPWCPYSSPSFFLSLLSSLTPQPSPFSMYSLPFLPPPPPLTPSHSHLPPPLGVLRLLGY